MARAIDADKLLRDLTYDFTGKPLHGNMKTTMANIRAIILAQPTLTQPNEPLTLDELREMDGKPVWIFRFEDGSGWRATVRIGKDRANADYGAYFMLSDYGKTWLAYRRQPEGEA